MADTYGDLRRCRDGSYWADPGDRFCPTCNGTGLENLDGVHAPCGRCDGRRRNYDEPLAPMQGPPMSEEIMKFMAARGL